jgi:hypothetical protein
MPGPYPYWEKLKTDVKKLFWSVAAIVLGLWALSYWLTPEKQRIAAHYKISEDHVVIDPEPHGCSFTDAPLGDKHCHYEQVVSVTMACPAPDCLNVGVHISWKRVEQ